MGGGCRAITGEKVGGGVPQDCESAQSDCGPRHSVTRTQHVSHGTRKQQGAVAKLSSQLSRQQ